MAKYHGWKVVDSDVERIRSLARRVREISESAENLERVRLWGKLNSLEGERPMVYIEPYARGLCDEVMAGVRWKCSEEWARAMERALVERIRQFETVKDDTPCSAAYRIDHFIEETGYGLEPVYKKGEGEGYFGSYVWEAPIKDLDRDMERLTPRAYRLDRERSEAWKAHLEFVFDASLDVQWSTGWGWSTTYDAINLVGLEGMMLLMYDNPAGLHRLMRFLHDDMLAFMLWLEREGLLTINSDDRYIGSGSVGRTDELPQKDWRPGQPVRIKDRWLLSESQESVGVGPDLFAEFIFPYQLDLARRAGLVYYGCCEPLHTRWHVIKRIPNLRKVSISPWCDEEFMAEAMAGKYVYCRKPKPTLISTEKWDEELIRADIRATLDATGARNVEFSMKDVHTVNNEPWRIGRWVELAREEIEKFMR